ncbi:MULTISPECIES: hypothetical protein [Gluconobacter]|uniref:hypothetical protein n=1 Tax=Gluconobacter TaxID=441 RepID=UPI00062C7264|nr:MULTISPECIES: hypothetical protein [Gluconobacter]
MKVVWTGNTGTGTSSARSYTRDYDITAPDKPTIEGSKPKKSPFDRKDAPGRLVRRFHVG